MSRPSHPRSGLHARNRSRYVSRPCSRRRIGAQRSMRVRRRRPSRDTRHRTRAARISLFAIARARRVVPASPDRVADILPVTSCADDNGPGTLRTVLAGAADGDTVDLSQLACGTITLALGAVTTTVDNVRSRARAKISLTIDGAHARSCHRARRRRHARDRRLRDRERLSARRLQRRLRALVRKPEPDADDDIRLRNRRVRLRGRRRRCGARGHDASSTARSAATRSARRATITAISTAAASTRSARWSFPAARSAATRSSFSAT